MAGFPKRSLSSTPAKGYPDDPFGAKMPAMKTTAGDPPAEQSGPVKVPANMLGPTAVKSSMAAKVRAALMMKLRGGK